MPRGSSFLLIIEKKKMHRCTAALGLSQKLRKLMLISVWGISCSLVVGLGLVVASDDGSPPLLPFLAELDHYNISNANKLKLFPKRTNERSKNNPDFNILIIV